MGSARHSEVAFGAGEETKTYVEKPEIKKAHARSSITGCRTGKGRRCDDISMELISTAGLHGNLIVQLISRPCILVVFAFAFVAFKKSRGARTLAQPLQEPLM